MNNDFINKGNINKNYYYETEKLIYECRKSNYIPIIIDEKLHGIINNFS